jgi:hypothetical protein
MLDQPIMFSLHEAEILYEYQERDFNLHFELWKALNATEPQDGTNLSVITFIPRTCE